jgi:RNA polymerase sigma-70 factor (ECF subfamily)
MQQDDYDRWIAPIRQRMVNCVWRIVRDPVETEDVIQDVLLHVLRKPDSIRRHPNPTVLLLRICVNKALDHLRNRNSRRAALDRLSAEPVAHVPTPAQTLAEDEERTRLLEFLQTLPSRESEAITLHVLEELDYPEVANAMGCRQSTVRVLIGRARKRFREAFGSSSSSRFANGEICASEPQED